jgi:hypothetical protein
METVEGMGSFSWGNVKMVVAPVVVRGGASSSSVALRSSLSSSTHLVTGASVRRWGGRCGFPRCLVSLTAATIAFSLDLRSDGWDERSGKIRVSEFGGLGDGGIGEEGRGGSEVSESLDSIVQITLFRPF